MGPGRGSTITCEWENSNPVTPSEIRWRGKKYSFHPERKEECKSPVQLRGSGTGKMCFHGLERVAIISGMGGGAVVRMIIVMEVRITSSVIVDPIRYEEPRCCITPARCIFPARLTSVTKLLTVDLFLPSVRRESLNFFPLTFAREVGNVERGLGECG